MERESVSRRPSVRPVGCLCLDYATEEGTAKAQRRPSEGSAAQPHAAVAQGESRRVCVDNVSLREMRASWRCSAPLTGRRGAGFRNVQPASVAFFAGQLARWLAGYL